MEIEKQLSRPANWQDFERLCKMLWGEIWQCREIMRNGRNGQEQQGVDIYGIPHWENQFYGIQCKVKDEYTNRQLSESEITCVIELAKSFTPQLKKLYLATTAVKNSKIEAFVRQKNVENIKQGLFEVCLFSWDDIVDLIKENQNTYNYYVNSLNYATSKSISVSFSNDSDTIDVEPSFIKKVFLNINQSELENYLPNNLDSFLQVRKKLLPHRSFNSLNTPKINYSLSSIQIKITNTGTQTIEDYKLIISFDKEIAVITLTNTIIEVPTFNPINRVQSDISIDKDNKTITISPHQHQKILVGGDVYITSHFYIKPNPSEDTIKLYWKLLARDFTHDGELFIKVHPKFIKKRTSRDDINADPTIEYLIEDNINYR